MPQYGYKISGFAKNEKFIEAEKFLDKKLKGYEKHSGAFEDDGSMSIVYRKDDAGNSAEVKLTKNITESAVMVFSDVPLKYFRHGGWRLYLRDIIPAIIFAAVFFAVQIINTKIEWPSPVMLLAEAALGALFFLVTQKAVSRNRSRLRVRFIQCGGIITMLLVLWNLHRYGFSLLLLFRTQIAALFGGLLIVLLIDRLIRKK